MRNEFKLVLNDSCNLKILLRKGATVPVENHHTRYLSFTDTQLRELTFIYRDEGIIVKSLSTPEVMDARTHEIHYRKEDYFLRGFFRGAEFEFDSDSHPYLVIDEHSNVPAKTISLPITTLSYESLLGLIPDILETSY